MFAPLSSSGMQDGAVLELVSSPLGHVRLLIQARCSLIPCMLAIGVHTHALGGYHAKHGGSGFLPLSSMGSELFARSGTQN